MCGEAARAGVASEDGEDAGECAESLAKHAAGGRGGGIGGIGGGKAERKRSGSISQRNLSFQSMASIGYSKEPYRFPEVGMEREREKVMGRMWSLSWCTIRSIDRCFL